METKKVIICLTRSLEGKSCRSLDSTIIKLKKNEFWLFYMINGKREFMGSNTLNIKDVEITNQRGFLFLLSDSNYLKGNKKLFGVLDKINKTGNYNFLVILHDGAHITNNSNEKYLKESSLNITNSNLNKFGRHILNPLVENILQSKGNDEFQKRFNLLVDQITGHALLRCVIEILHELISGTTSLDDSKEKLKKEIRKSGNQMEKQPRNEFNTRMKTTTTTEEFKQLLSELATEVTKNI